MPRLKKRKRSNSVPMFIEKLAIMLQDEDIQNIISWNNTGDRFLIKNITKFVTDVLPKFYKHNNLASFIRQLNMHNFHKVKDEDKPKQSNEDAYSHPKFLRDQPALFKQIKRKSEKRQDDGLQPCEDIKNEINQLKKRQDILFKKYQEIVKRSQQLIQFNQYLEEQLKKLNKNGVCKIQRRNKQKAQIKEQEYLVNQFMDYSNLKYLQNKNFGLESFMDVDQQLNPKQTLQMLRNKYQDQ